MTDPRPLLRQIASEDRHGAVWCAGLCAMSVAHLWSDDPRPRRAVRLALAWAVGVPVPVARLRSASAADADAAVDYAAYAAYAAAAAVDYAAYAVSDYAAAYAVSDYAAARARHLAALHDLVVSQTTPVTPSPRDVRLTRPSSAVVWDQIADTPSARHGTLGEALARAHRLHLRWHDPVERALAERLPLDHPALAALRIDGRVPR